MSESTSDPAEFLRGACADPDSPIYGSDLVPPITELIEDVERLFSESETFKDWNGCLVAALHAIETLRNEFSGPSLDYMQGYRDGQKVLQDMARSALRPHSTGAQQ